MLESRRTLRPETPDPQLDRMVATAVFGYAITEGPEGQCAAHTGAGADSRLVDLPPVSTDIGAAWQAATMALDEGQADGFDTRIACPPDGPPEFQATFLRRQGADTLPICGASAESMPRAICAALLTLYQGAGRARLSPPPRSLQ